jgi:hypothetical protein
VNHQADPSSVGKFLEKIASEFCRFREKEGGHCPERLKSMALSAVGMGLSSGSVAEAAGVSATTIRNWAAKSPKAKQLTLVASPEAAWEHKTALAADLVCIRLASGVEIDFPRRELSVEFLSILNSIGGSR